MKEYEMLRGIILASCIFAISSCAPAIGNKPSATQQPDSGGWKSQPIAVQWEGYDDLFSGTVRYRETASSGHFIIDLPKDEGTCEGDYTYSGSAKATWTVTCTNDLAATGTLTPFGKDKGGSGVGTDNHGRSVRFTVGEASP